MEIGRKYRQTEKQTHFIHVITYLVATQIQQSRKTTTIK